MSIVYREYAIVKEKNTVILRFSCRHSGEWAAEFGLKYPIFRFCLAFWCADESGIGIRRNTPIQLDMSDNLV